VSAAAQLQTGAQAGAQSSSQASVQAGQTQAQASGGASTSTAASAQNGQASGSVASGTAFNAALSSPVDSKKCKPGDAVKRAHHRSCEVRRKDRHSEGLEAGGTRHPGFGAHRRRIGIGAGIVFDKAILKNGQEIPLSAGIQRLPQRKSGVSAAGSDMDTVGGMGASGLDQG